MANEKNDKLDDSKATGDIKLPGSERGKQLTSRRSFAKSGIAGGAVLMSLLSRPALGSGTIDPRCTGSILASIDAGTSLHDFDPESCRFGCTPGFWCIGRNAQPPTVRAWDWITTNTPTNIHYNDDFLSVFGCGPEPVVPIPTTYVKQFPGGTRLNDLMCRANEGDAPVKQAARHGIAALLNAHILGVFYSPYTPAEIIADYCYAYSQWTGTAMGTGTEIPTGSTDELQAFHKRYAAFNDRDNCPLDNSKNNYFYKPPI